MYITPPKIERCGFCGRFFIEKDFLSDSSIQQMTQEEIDVTPLGYCPEAEGEHDHNRMRVTRDMAIDAGDLSLEGTYIY